MAPALLLEPEITTGVTSATAKKEANKPTVYVIDPWHPKAIEHARTLFNVVLNTDKDFQGWQEKATAILMRGSYLRRDDIEKCPKLIAIGKHGVGIDKIDAQECASRGIKILNTPGANAQAVAELVLALTMSVARQIPSIATRQLKEPVHKQSCNGVTLHGKSVGIIGMGSIGRKVANMFRGAFNAPIMAYDPYMPADAWSDIEHTRVQSYTDILAHADVLTIHVPLTEETRGMISYKELSHMKQTAILINASRGGIVDEKDLQRALSESLIWGAGLDAHEEEPPTVERYGELWELPNVVSTPHIGAATEDAQLASALGAVDNLYNYLVSLN
ncbi:D-3-phosphoglycerate dehydrogenase [Diaporthe amygdali]|uniref:D-3-phosphoglycerate dehydrogenase n=1 Tax=Phomopsis amygdali TaxID=1214568 RepID=UPI0022FE5353|nr:D-3-phosphoglycerate dehydrogenase [Diaporthe amygdali]KAJ0104009.1 D-3-phosphoglycerate dehydrogenase [Diaporthe amygdali]